MRESSMNQRACGWRGVLHAHATCACTRDESSLDQRDATEKRTPNSPWQRVERAQGWGTARLGRESLVSTLSQRGRGYGGWDRDVVPLRVLRTPCAARVGQCRSVDSCELSIVLACRSDVDRDRIGCAASAPPRLARLRDRLRHLANCVQRRTAALQRVCALNDDRYGVYLFLYVAALRLGCTSARRSEVRILFIGHC